MTSAEYHGCVVCSKNILKDSYIIEKHVSTHGISSMNEYRRKLIVARNTKGPSTESLNHLGNSFKSPILNYFERDAAMKKAMEVTNNSCVFSCKECDKVFNNWDVFRRHMRESHGMMQVSLEPERFSRTRAYHRCAVCGKKLLKDSSLIHIHVKCHKGLSGMKSYRQFLANEMAQKYHDIPDFKYTPESETQPNVKSTVNNSLLGVLGPNSVNINGISDSESSRTSQDKGDEHSLMLENTTTDEIAEQQRENTLMSMQEAIKATSNSCTFACKKCISYFIDWFTFERHMNTYHDMMHIQLEPEDYATLMFYHKCAVCDKQVLKDLGVIRTHIRSHGHKGITSYRQFLISGKDLENPSSVNLSPIPEPESNTIPNVLPSDSHVPLSKDKPAKSTSVSGSESGGISHIHDIEDESHMDSENTAESEMVESHTEDDPEYLPEHNAKDSPDQEDECNVEFDKTAESEVPKNPTEKSYRILQRRPTEKLVVDNDPDVPDHLPSITSLSESHGTPQEKQDERIVELENTTESTFTEKQGENFPRSYVEDSTNNEVTVNPENQPPQSPSTLVEDSIATAQLVMRPEPPKESPKPFLANECRFQCNKCEGSFGSWRELRTHVGKTHKQKYIKCNYNEYVVARCRVYHDCAECGTKVLQDDDIIRLHVLTHGINNLDDYAKVYEEKAANNEGAEEENWAAVESTEDPPGVVPKQEPTEDSFTFVDVVDPIAVQVDNGETAECNPTRARSSSRHSVASSNMSSEIIQRSPTLKRKTESTVNNGVEAKRRMMDEQGSNATPDLFQPEVQPSFTPADQFRRVNSVSTGDGVEKAQKDTSIPKPARKIDPRVLQLKKLQVLIMKGSIFKCTICGRILIKSTLADANRHCLKEHSVNIVQYFKMASGMSEGEFDTVSVGNV